jgi:hypothetical protein
MQRFVWLGVADGLVPAFWGISAQAEMLPLGRASNGAIITLDTDSIPRMSRRSANSGTLFTYYLGNERIDAEAICTRGIWTVDGQQYKPQSQATRNMVSMACSLRFESGEDMGTVLVFDPPSNVRVQPNGAVKCTLGLSAIDVYAEPRGDWYSTTACGGGWIHKSQFRPFR